MTLAFETHNHTQCVHKLENTFETRCRQAGLKVTAIRRHVFKILIQEHRAHGAYDILAKLTASGYKAQPPLAYRALDFLVLNGFAHKIEHLNAFIACGFPETDHSPTFLICRICDRVEETRMPLIAMDGGFYVERTISEAKGVCIACRDSERLSK